MTLRASRLWSPRGIAWLGALLVGGMLALASYDILQGYRAAVRATERELDSHARVVAEQTARSLQAIEVVMRHIATQFRRGAFDGLQSGELRAVLQEQAVGLVQADGLLLVGPDGHIRATTYLPAARDAQVDLSGGDLFRLAREGTGERLYIASARSSVTDGEWIFPIGRRLVTAQGEFGGAIAARGRIAYFQDFYRDVRLDEGTTIALVNPDRTLMARHPPIVTALGKPLPLSPAAATAFNARRAGLTRTASPLDGLDRFVAQQPVPVYGLAVFVTREARVALAPWRDRSIATGVRTLALAALTAVLLWLLARQIARLDATRRQLEKSQDRFSLAVAGSDDGIWEHDFETGRAFNSARARELVGMPPGPEEVDLDEWLSSLPRYLHPEDLEARKAAMDAHLAGRTPTYEVDVRHRHDDGEYRWVRVRGVCVRDAQGKPLRMAGSVSDIDARKRAEAALRASEEQYRSIFNAAQDSMVLRDADFRIVDVNAAYVAVAGVSREEAIGQDRVLSDDSGQLERLLRERHQRVLAGESMVEVQRIQRDGQRVDLELHMLPVSYGGKPHVLFSGRNITERKQAEETLRASEERFALAVAGSNDGIIDWDVVRDRMYVSERALEILGIRTRDSVRTRAEWMSELRLHPDDVAQMQDSLQWVFEGEGTIRERELRVQWPGGDYRWVRIRGKLMREPSGRPLRWAGSVTDVDARRRAEERMRESDERFQLAVAGSNDGIIDWDLVHDRMYASERALEILGIRSDVTVRSRAEWRDLIQYHPDDQARMSRDLQDFLDGRSEMRDGEYRVLQPDGSYRWIRHRNKCVRDAAGRPLRVAGSIGDVDAQKRAEERFQLAVEGSHQGLWDWDLRSDLNYISPRLQEIMGLEPGEPLRPRKEWLALTRVHPDDLERVKEAQRAHRYGESAHLAIEYRIGLPSGEWRWVRQRGVALRDGQGKPYRIAGSTEDITAFKNAEAERARLEDQLLQAKKLEAIGTLAGGIAHDFNNILAAILGYGEMAQKASSPGSPLRRHVDAVVAAGLRAKSLVERILAFSRSGVGARVAVGVQSVVAEALGLVTASLPAGVRLESALGAPDAAVMGDPTQIHQVVMNLCANAAQAMKAGGTLTVTLDVVDKAETQAATSTLAAGRYVRLAVADTGTGISEDVRERIFDPFFTTKGAGVGTGLGLSLVHGIATDLGGGIDVESHPGKGTRFTVYLPWSAARVEESSIEEVPPMGAGQTILLVDDEEPLVRLGEELIAGLGYEPVGFTSSAAALAEFRAAPGRFQAVLSDETMPELTGSALAQEIRRLRPDIPIVLMSGFVSPALSARARGLGIAEVLSKPLVERDIARALAGALNGHPRGQP